MSDPDWYRDWRHDAVHQLQEKNRRLEAEFRIGTWPRWDYDIDAGTLIFSESGVAKVATEIQIVGTTSTKAGNWLWSWANGHWPVERATDAERAREFGQTHGIDELTSDYVTDEDLNALGWELTAVTVRLTGAIGAYRPPSPDGGALFLLCKTVTWAC